MSILNNLTQLFSRKKAPDSEQSVGLSLAMPDDLSSVQAPAAAQGKPAAAEPAAAEAAAQAADQDDVISVPLLGRRRIAEHQRILWWLLGLALVVLGAVAFVALTAADRVAQQLNATGQALMQSQRLAKSVTQALVGVPQAFVEVRESSGILARTVRGLRDSDYALRLDPLDPQLMPQLEKILPLVDRAEKNAAAILAQEKVLTQVGTALRTINRQSSDLLEIAETVSSLKLQQGASPAEISAAGQLVMLTQRIGKSSNEFLTAEGVSPEAVFLLGKDLNSFKEIAQGLLNGSPELRLNPTKDAQTREQIEALIKLYEQTRTQAGAILGNLQGLVSARTAQIAIVGILVGYAALLEFREEPSVFGQKVLVLVGQKTQFLQHAFPPNSNSLKPLHHALIPPSRSVSRPVLHSRSTSSASSRMSAAARGGPSSRAR